MAKKYKSNIKDVNEYMTSKTCHSCQNINKDLGSKKIYKCSKCCIEIDRDINASINIYIKGPDEFVNKFIRCDKSCKQLL